MSACVCKSCLWHRHLSSFPYDYLFTRLRCCRLSTFVSVLSCLSPAISFSFWIYSLRDVRKTRYRLRFVNGLHFQYLSFIVTINDNAAGYSTNFFLFFFKLSSPPPSSPPLVFSKKTSIPFCTGWLYCFYGNCVPSSFKRLYPLLHERLR